jgi:hypothetical protein
MSGITHYFSSVYNFSNTATFDNFHFNHLTFDEIYAIIY